MGRPRGGQARGPAPAGCTEQGTPPMDDIQRTLRAFLVDELLDPGVSLSADAELAALGVDSFALMEVLLFVERRWGVPVPMDRLTPENTRTVASLAACIAEVVAPAA